MWPRVLFERLNEDGRRRVMTPGALPTEDAGLDPVKLERCGRARATMNRRKSTCPQLDTLEQSLNLG